MTKDDLVSKDTALKMAIEALEMHVPHYVKDRGCEAIQACKEALEHPAQEIVRKVFDIDNFHSSVLDRIKFTSPQQWQGLTSEEIESLDLDNDVISVIFQTEMLLKEKNT